MTLKTRNRTELLILTHCFFFACLRLAVLSSVEYRVLGPYTVFFRLLIRQCSRTEKVTYFKTEQKLKLEPNETNNDDDVDDGDTGDFSLLCCLELPRSRRNKDS